LDERRILAAKTRKVSPMNPNEKSTPTQAPAVTPTSIPSPAPANEPAKTAPAGPSAPEKRDTLRAPDPSVEKV
jgi:hypothetical protein